jgi:hypothetical protein
MEGSLKLYDDNDPDLVQLVITEAAFQFQPAGICTSGDSSQRDLTDLRPSSGLLCRQVTLLTRIWASAETWVEKQRFVVEI